MLKAVWLLCIALLASCRVKDQILTEQERMTVMEMTKNTTPRCVGRYLIDLPVNAMPIGEATFEGIKVNAQAQRLVEFQHDMDAREAELKAARNPLGYQFFFESGKVRGVENTRYLIYNNELSDAHRNIEVHKWDRGYQITLRIEGTDWSKSVDRDKSWVKAKETKNDVPQKSRLAFDLIAKLQGRPEDMIPTEPGTCFVGGVMPGKAISEKEEVSTSYVLADKTDVSFSWHSFADLQATSSLLPRVRSRSVQEALKTAKGHIIRSGNVVLSNGMKADEVLVSALTLVEVRGHHCSLEANYQGSPQAPYIVLDMETASPNFLAEADTITQSSLTEGESVALWDAVSRSLRPRPNAF
ncbi:T6SS immunity protein Tli4 family protein [Burkholderia anthina]|uniref:T6SS immunity protein Tli4 family protein n=1 Tax=Burkholderia anthina TaxID=179879 RepID=UPI00158E8369|nr:T6SS immunity protein Tli4 family protein [Burkholderia anthina]